MPVPLATYRVQLHAEFGFEAAAAIADYLSALGVSHLYASPYLQANQGSTHGYDILDHSRVSEEIGGAEAHAKLCETLGRNRLGQILDVVPNHMSISSRDNVWWWDVLENGQSSLYAHYFDVDWQPPEQKLHDTVLLPILGDHYGRIVDAGEIKLQHNNGSFTFHYHDHVMPVAPRSLNELLERAARRCDSPDLAFIADSFANLPHSTATDGPSVTRRHRDKEVLRKQLSRLCAENPAIASAIDSLVEEINVSPNEIDLLLDRQNYRLAYWRSAGQELDYRRFFDINTLVSMRIEDERVFHDMHVLVLKWVRQGVLDGLRVDHPDGLRDPAQYFQRLKQAVPHGWIVVEKILEPGETLPQDWPVAGTTGYDFLNRLGSLLIDQEGEGPISEFYSRFTGVSTDYLAMVHQKKHFVLKKLFGSDINRLTFLLAKVCERQKRYRDYSRRELDAMLREVIACFPVYRSYVRAEAGQVSDRDTLYVTEAIESAKRHRPEIDEDLLDFLRDLLLLRVRGTLESELVMRFQQHTGPVMAKGIEDTVFYNYNRLVALNEVGGDPGRFGLALDQFHADCRETQEHWSQSMIATTTHDTKRSEDVRARISLLAEIPDRWAEAVERWARHNEPYKTGGFPDRNIEYLLYQTLVGAWPIDTARTLQYVQKVAREAKAYTSWTDPDPDYEEALRSFVVALLADPWFVADLNGFLTPLIEPGRINSLAQVLIKLTAPGVPDIYQGNELWDLSLVDPDNRRPVDYETRRRLLDVLQTATAEEVLARSDEGLPKMWVTKQALALRKRLPVNFGPEGEYRPILAEGPRADHVVAFARGHGCVVVAPRLPLRLGGRWENTTLPLPDGEWYNELTGDLVPGGSTPLATLLKRFPVALLSSAEH
ncbi:malto-oligosyltrehalose synthase [Singulisphaera acidiphila]|uniref:Malto-oligosyltrehalose synthase n=1 Tax=Singulisphaera acidiphila (strain ATCC BAA-1392 / DSM 18658 / VKM B-2454 / MOB10) TaxID=886293 RepID=L0DMT4_SINAD|nr:malto-oligosyltrehalose synthase [Singulisphaera acidiphila]AGA29976.1 malto-oligosyltrehalose synthase [Singulisphaera acidiphila DSM 18658]